MYITVRLSDHPLMGLCAVSTFWQLSVVLLQTCVHVFVWVPVFSFLGYTPRSWIARSYGNSVFNFLRSGQTALHKAEPFYTLSSNEQRVPISPPNPSLVIFHLIYYFCCCCCLSSGYKGFVLHLPDNWWCWASCTCWPFIYLWRNVYSSPLPIFNQVIFLLLS